MIELVPVDSLGGAPAFVKGDFTCGFVTCFIGDAVTTTRGGPIFTDSRRVCGERGVAEAENTKNTMNTHTQQGK